MKGRKAELQMPDELTPEERAIMEEAKKVEFPSQAQDPSTGEVKRFRSQKELNDWRRESREEA